MEWEWFDDANLFKFFIGLILLANHDSVKWHGITVGRGEIVTSRERLASQFNFSEQQIRTMLKKLQNSGEITIKPTNKYTILNICNYDSYQCAEVDNQPTNQPTNNQQITNNQPTNNQQITTNKNDKNVKNENNEKNINADKSAKHTKFIPPTLEEVKTYCQERKNTVDPQRFIDFYSAKGWMVGKNKMKDWRASVRTWEQPKQTKLPFAGNGGESLNRNIEGIWK